MATLGDISRWIVGPGRIAHVETPAHETTPAGWRVTLCGQQGPRYTDWIGEGVPARKCGHCVQALPHVAVA